MPDRLVVSYDAIEQARVVLTSGTGGIDEAMGNVTPVGSEELHATLLDASIQDLMAYLQALGQELKDQVGKVVTFLHQSEQEYRYVDSMMTTRAVPLDQAKPAPTLTLYGPVLTGEQVLSQQQIVTTGQVWGEPGGPEGTPLPGAPDLAAPVPLTYPAQPLPGGPEQVAPGLEAQPGATVPWGTHTENPPEASTPIPANLP